MNDFRNMLYAIDLDSENSFSLIYALEFAKMFNCRLHIVYINDPMAGYRHPTDREDAVALRVKEVAPESLLENMDIVYAAFKGDAAEEIIKYARKYEVDLILVGHKHHNKLYSSFFDTTDVNIIDMAQQPILVIPEKEP